MRTPRNMYTIHGMRHLIPLPLCYFWSSCTWDHFNPPCTRSPFNTTPTTKLRSTPHTPISLATLPTVCVTRSSDLQAPCIYNLPVLC